MKFVVVIVVYGFTMTVSGSQVEYANDDFVRGQPERLEKICEPFVARLKQDNELRLKLNNGKQPILEFDAGWVLIHGLNEFVLCFVF